MRKLPKFYLLLILPLSILIGACAHSRVSASAGTGGDSLMVYPNDLVDGAVALVVSKVPDRKLQSCAFDDGRQFRAMLEPDGYSSVLVGLEYGKVGRRVLTCVVGENASTVETVFLDVRSGQYPSEVLRVPPRTVSPKKRDLKRIRSELKILDRVYASSGTQRLWTAPVQVPVDNIVTSIYGSARVYNGIKSNVHYGTDYRAPTGTPIVAPLDGRVVLVKNLFFTGNTVIIDHGLDFFTIYAHMSATSVVVGQLVSKGTSLGSSGATGRASGPHLHLGVRLAGLKVDPQKVFELINARDGARSAAAK